jgi:hypothetical protein
MRQTISGLVAAIAVVTASAAPALACGGYSPCYTPQVYVSPAPTYGYSGCNTGCGGWAYERLPDPVHQYYYVNQGPTYTGPGNFAPYQSYEEDALPTWGYRHHRHYWGHHYWGHHYGYGYGTMEHPYRYRHYGYRGYGYREYGYRHALRRYY